MAIAKHAPSADPGALTVVSVMQSQMRPGYPASHNSFGTFTRGLLSIARAAAPTVANIAGQFNPTLGKVIKGVNEAVGIAKAAKKDAAQAKQKAVTAEQRSASARRRSRK
jgi:type IV secretory pathway TrbL component